MWLIKLSIIFLSFIFIKSWEDNSDLILQIKDGKILGRYITSETGKIVKAFMSIPYAQPPVGDLRFKAPQKAQPWQGIRNSQFDPPMCLQMSSQSPLGQEDCLYLNVYAPAESDKKLSVIYWIHGGAFVAGESSRAFYAPDYILDNDVVMVSGNYRLGPFGFLSTEDKNAQGNFAMKDQHMILEWIKENIEYFGGDKDSVTIWGESAGSVSVNYQMLSPMSRGLFHKAISNSGTIHNAWADPWHKSEAIEATNRLAQAVNCSTIDTYSTVNCLKSKEAVDLLRASVAASTKWEPRMAIEDFSELSEFPFLRTRSLTNESIDIPWMLGITSEDGLALSDSFITSQIRRDQLIATWNEELPKIFDYSHLNAETRLIITQKVTQFYFGSYTLMSGFNYQNLTNLYTDAYFLGMIQTLENRFSHTNFANTFVYLFTHKGSASFSSTEEYEGTSHVDDLIYLYPMHKIRFYSSMPTSDDEILIKEMPKMWTNFAKYGNPTPSISSRAIAIPPWPIATSVPFNFMTIGNKNGIYENLGLFKIGNDLYNDRANFLKNLKEDYKLSRWNGAITLKMSALMCALLLILLFIVK